MPSSKWRRLPLTLETSSLLPSTHSMLILAASIDDVVLAAGDARPDERSVVSEHFHGAETDFGISGRLEDQVGLADLGGEARERRLPRAHVMAAIGFDDRRLAMRAGPGRERVDLDSPQPEHHRGEQADLAGPQHERPLGVPDLQPLLGEEGLFDRLGADAGRLGEHAEVLQVLRHLHDEFGVVDEVLGQIAVAEVDSALVVDLVAGDVVPADQVEDRLTRAADGAGDIVARQRIL